MDLAELTQARREITLAGRKYKVRALRAREWGELHGWLKDHAEDPFTQAVRQVARTKAAGAPITLEQEDFLLSEARKEAKAWPPRVTSAEWFEAIGTTEGGDVEFLLAVLRTGHPDLTHEEAQVIAKGMEGPESTDLVLIALGPDPSPKVSGPLPISTSPKKKRPDPKKMTGRASSTS